MNDPCDYKVGDWHKKLGYFKECPVCKTTFWGRKNQKYCDPKCKGKVAIEKLAAKNKKYGKNIQQYMKNAEILESLYPGLNELKPVPKALLYGKGFNDSGIQKKVKYKRFEGEWNLIGEYAYKLDESKQNIFIIKSKDNGKL